MSSIKQLVRELAISLPEGCSCRVECPDCHAKGTFSMSRNAGTLSYICFRAACTCRGSITSRGDVETTVQKNRRQVKLFNGTLSTLNEYEEEYLSSKFRIDTEWLGNTRFCEDDMRVYYPQYNTMGKVQGYIARYYPELNNDVPLRGAKAIWKPVLNSAVGLCFPNMEVMQQVIDTKSVCVVEDYPSMLRINNQLNVPTCCLGGTNVYQHHISTMLELGVSDLTIVLDADAVTKAVKIQRAIALTFDSVKIIPLSGADPKDMPRDELTATLKQLR